MKCEVMNCSVLLPIMSGRRRDLKAKLIRSMLTCMSWAYQPVIATRNYTFHRGIRASHRLPRPVISIGNITAGGTGKTPMVIELARRLEAMGQKPAVLLRGYGADAKIQSDEYTELKETLGKKVMVQADPDRFAGARRVIEKHPDTTCFLLDDGFQHRQVQRELDIILIDAALPFGYGHLLPRGLLREPLRNIRRADAIIVTRSDQVDEDTMAEIDNRIADLTSKTPLAHCRQYWTKLKQDQMSRPVEDLKSMRVAAACGIGNPDVFDRMLKKTTSNLIWSQHFNDHHAFDPGQIQALINQARHDGAEALVITEKDWMKWRSHLPNLQSPLPILRPEISIRFIDGEQALHALLRKTICQIR